MQSPVENLRERAYDILSMRTPRNSRFDKKNVDSLIEELLLHQVELELQNISLAETHTQLEKVHQEYLDLYNLAPVGYFTLTENGLISEVNIAGTELLNRAKKKLINRCFVSYVAPESKLIFNAYFRHLVNAHTSESCQIKMITDGTGSFLAKLEGRIINKAVSNEKQFLIVVSNVTHYQIAVENEILRNQKIEEDKANHAKDIFLSNLSHELRTPMTAILTRSMR